MYMHTLYRKYPWLFIKSYCIQLFILFIVRNNLSAEFADGWWKNVMLSNMFKKNEIVRMITYYFLKSRTEFLIYIYKCSIHLYNCSFYLLTHAVKQSLL